MPISESSVANFLANSHPFLLQLLEPTIAMLGFCNNSKLPSKYKVLGGLGIVLNFSGYKVLLISIFFNKITFYAVGRTDYHAILMDSVTIDKDLNVSSISMVEDGDQNYCISKNGESITITSKDCADFEVSVFDTTGKLVRRIKATEYLSINGLCKGIYILNIRSKGNNQTCKILI